MDKNEWKKLLEKIGFFEENFAAATGFSGNVCYNEDAIKSAEGGERAWFVYSTRPLFAGETTLP